MMLVKYVSTQKFLIYIHIYFLNHLSEGRPCLLFCSVSPPENKLGKPSSPLRRLHVEVWGS